jgi:hypothetical protein
MNANSRRAISVTCLRSLIGKSFRAKMTRRVWRQTLISPSFEAHSISAMHSAFFFYARGFGFQPDANVPL